jgi:hypothetical protein
MFIRSFEAIKANACAVYGFSLEYYPAAFSPSEIQVFKNSPPSFSLKSFIKKEYGINGSKKINGK